MADKIHSQDSRGNKYVRTRSGLNISIRHRRVDRDKVVVLAPGFFQSKEAQIFKQIENGLFGCFDVISMDFRGHGKSQGGYTFSAKEPEDLAAVLDYARQSYSKVGVLAFSYAGAIAMIEASREKNIDSLICVSAPMASEKIDFKWWRWASFRLAWRGLRPGAGVRPWNPFMKKIRPIDIVDAVSPAPILFIHGTDDPTIGIRHSVHLHQAAREPKAIKVFEKASHAEDIYRTHRDEFMKTVVDWFQERLAA